MFDFQSEDWHTTDIDVDSLWIIDKRDSGGKHSNEYHGNFVPQTISSICGDDLSDCTFCDIFAGTGIVGRTFKSKVKK